MQQPSSKEERIRHGKRSTASSVPQRRSDPDAVVQPARRHARAARADASAQRGRRQTRGYRTRLLRRARGPGARRRYRAVRYTRAGTRDVQDIPTLAAVPRIQPRTGAGHPGEDILQVRGQQHERLAQAQFGHRAGLLRQGSGARGHHDRDRGGAVGHGARRSRRPLRPRPRRVHGEVLLRAEALPAQHHGDVQCQRDALALRHDRDRPQNARGAPRFVRVARHGYLRGGRASAQHPREQGALHARIGAQPGGSAPEHHRPRILRGV